MTPDMVYRQQRKALVPMQNSVTHRYGGVTFSLLPDVFWKKEYPLITEIDTISFTAAKRALFFELEQSPG